MSDDRWPDEPDEPYAERYGEPDVEPDEPVEGRFAEPDPDELVPEIPDESNADPELVRTFWGLVVTINLGLFAASLGLMLVGFQGRWTAGGGVFLLGVAALGWAWYKYRHRND